MIQCKRVYDPQEASDGYRILVDRLCTRGIKKEALNYDEWCKILAPSTDLRKAFHGETLDFAHFSQRYRQELEAHRDEGERLYRACQAAAADAALRGEKHPAKPCPGAG